jgi:DNA ligase-1
MAPDWFLNSLPACFLDGELWAGRGQFQLNRSICGGDKPDPRFKKVKYAAYSAPSFQSLFQDGEIKNTNMLRAIDSQYVRYWLTERLERFEGDFQFCPALNFQQELLWMSAQLETQSDTCYMLKQEKLPLDEGQANLRVAEFLDYVIEVGGEGAILRDPQSCWTPKRHKGLLKYKPFSDAEATITGFTSGRETAKGSRLLGMIGSLIVEFDGHRLELAGLTDAEREFSDEQAVTWARRNPGQDAPEWVQGKSFQVGQVVTFKYRELWDSGIPKDGRYWRRRDVE